MKTKDDIILEAQNNFAVTVSENDDGITRQIAHHAMDLWATEVQKNNSNNPDGCQNIPYQCCPLCNGSGQTIADMYTSAVFQVCKVCSGQRIIPMHQIIK